MPEGLTVDARRSTSHPPSIKVECWSFKSHAQRKEFECSTFRFESLRFKSFPPSIDVE